MSMPGTFTTAKVIKAWTKVRLWSFTFLGKRISFLCTVGVAHWCTPVSEVTKEHYSRSAIIGTNLKECCAFIMGAMQESQLSLIYYDHFVKNSWIIVCFVLFFVCSPKESKSARFARFCAKVSLCRVEGFRKGDDRVDWTSMPQELVYCKM